MCFNYAVLQFLWISGFTKKREVVEFTYTVHLTLNCSVSYWFAGDDKIISNSVCMVSRKLTCIFVIPVILTILNPRYMFVHIVTRKKSRWKTQRKDSSRLKNRLKDVFKKYWNIYGEITQNWSIEGTVFQILNDKKLTNKILCLDCGGVVGIFWPPQKTCLSLRRSQRAEIFQQSVFCQYLPSSQRVTSWPFCFS